MAAVNFAGRSEIQKLIPDFFKQFDAEHVIHDAWELEAIDQPEWIEAMVAWIDDHEHRFPEKRASLDEEQLVMLSGLQVQFREQLLEQVEHVKNWSWHLALKRTMEVAWDEAWQSPLPNHLYILWDHMVL